MNVTIANANASSNVNLIRNIKQEPLDDDEAEYYEDNAQLYKRRFENFQIII